MLLLIARMAGILLWIPAVGVPVPGGVMLAPYELLLVVLQPILWITALDRKRLPMVAIALAIVTLAYAASVNRSASTVYYVFFVLFTIPNFLLLLNLFEDKNATRVFVSTFIKTGIWMTPIAILQFVSPYEIPLTNNVNYALSSGVQYRAWGFTPEASILAALYIVSIAMTLFNLCRRADPGIPGSIQTIVILSAGLYCTNSSSTLTLLPLIAVYVLLLCRVSWKYFTAAGVIGAVSGWLFYVTLYGIRIESGSTVSSVGIRLATDIVAVIIVAKNWATGLGPGMNNDATDDVMMYFFLLTGHVGETKEGFNNFVLAQMVELGVLPGILSIAGLFLLMRFLWRRRDVPAEPIDFVCIFGVAICVIGSIIGGYRGLAVEWLYYPAAAAVYIRQRWGLPGSTTPVPLLPAAVVGFDKGSRHEFS